MNRNLVKVYRQQQVYAAFEPDNIWYQLRTSVACPPDKTVNVRGGVVTPSARWATFEETDILPSVEVDFTNTESTGIDLSFTNSGYFFPIILCLAGDWIAYQGYDDPDIYEYPIFDNVTGTEVATAAEAESQIDGFLNGVDQWYNYRLPLSGIVFKNDGNTEATGSILPIDCVNRGRSYLYRDARVRRGALP